MSESIKKREGSEKVSTIGEASWLEEYMENDTSTDDMMEHRVLPRIKLIQGTSDEDLKDLLGEGSAILTPGNAIICKKKGTFRFVPLYFWNEYTKWSDLKDKESAVIMERTTDPNSDLARRCKDYELRVEEYEPGSKMKYKYVQMLNFAVYITDGDYAGTGAIYPFMRGEFSNGEAFVNAVTMNRRNGKRIPLWAFEWEMKSNFRDRGPDKKWHGLDFSPVGVIDAADAPNFQASHLEMKKLQKSKLLAADFTDQDAGAESSVEVASDM